MLGFKEHSVLCARPMLTHNVTELVISFTSDEIDLELMPTSGHHYVIRVFRGDDMNTIYTGVYCHGVLHLGCLGKVTARTMLIRLIVLVKGFAKYI